MSMQHLTEHVIPSLESTDWRREDNESLAALGHMQLSLYELLVSGGIAFPGHGKEECKRRVHRAIDLLDTRLQETSGTYEQATLLHARYALSHGMTGPFDNAGTQADDPCGRIARRLTAACDGTDARTESAVCRCVTDMLYPVPETDRESHAWLTARLRRWADTLDDNGHWPGLDATVAAERTEVLHRNAFMLLDNSHDDTLRRAAAACNATSAAVTALPLSSPGAVRLALALYRLHFSMTYRPDAALSLRLKGAAANAALPRGLRLSALAATAHAAVQTLVLDVQERLAV